MTTCALDYWEIGALWVNSRRRRIYGAERTGEEGEEEVEEEEEVGDVRRASRLSRRHLVVVEALAVVMCGVAVWEARMGWVQWWMGDGRVLRKVAVEGVARGFVGGVVGLL